MARQFPRSSPTRGKTPFILFFLKWRIGAESSPAAKLLLFTCLFVFACRSAAAPASLQEDYNQWKQALGTNVATAVSQITALPGFSVELLRSAGPDEGSWVAMAFDPQGRLVIAREDRGLLRLTLPARSDPLSRVEIINTNLLECRGLLFAYDALYVNANNSKALYRLRDTMGHDQFDEVKLLRSTPGGVGHGRNQLALGPDGMIYSIHGDDVGLPLGGVSAASPFQHYADDRLLPCEWDKHLFNASAVMPFGHLIRTDRDGKIWELVAGGLRNPFGIDFNEQGDLFTFDADMEWDVGLSWYHPTRVLHLVPGGDYGWRRGTGVLPDWFPDTLPSVVDVGLASPTAIKFGTKGKFPRRWRDALFILDWSYGKIYAVHLQPRGLSYSGRSEIFLKGRPLNVTGLDFGPDGAMYIITGGRRTQSGLYRVSWRGAGGNESATLPGGSALAVKREYARNIWEEINDTDPWARHAARVTLEKQPVSAWSGRALSENRPTAALTALLALSRVAPASLQTNIAGRIEDFFRSPLSADQQVIALRSLSVCFIRMGRPQPALAARCRDFFEPRYPAMDARVNQLLCELLVYLGSTHAIGKTLALLPKAATQEEKAHYLFVLSRATHGWTLAERRNYFEWLERARQQFQGANMLPTALNYMRADAEKSLTSDERLALADILAVLAKPPGATAAPLPRRAQVKEWSMIDLADLQAKSTNVARGQKVFTDAGCAQCHRVRNGGGVIGPDLTGVGRRFDRRALLESIIEPSKVIADIYRNVSITTRSGAMIDGRILSEDSKALVVSINPVDPDQRTRVLKDEVVAQRASDTSPMPAGLLDTLQREEILDLLAWLELSGEP